MSPPNQRSWFFTEGEVVSGKPCWFLRREVYANFVDDRWEAARDDPDRPRLPSHTHTPGDQAGGQRARDALLLLFWTTLTVYPQNDGSAGLFQPLDDIFDEAMPKIVRAVNGRTSDDAFPPISQEDVLFLTRCDCVVNALKGICDFQGAPPRSHLLGRLVLT